MNTMSSGLIMPGNYNDMDACEREYGGGFDWGKFFAVCGIVFAAG